MITGFHQLWHNSSSSVQKLINISTSLQSHKRCIKVRILKSTSRQRMLRATVHEKKACFETISWIYKAFHKCKRFLEWLDATIHPPGRTTFRGRPASPPPPPSNTTITFTRSESKKPTRKGDLFFAIYSSAPTINTNNQFLPWLSKDTTASKNLHFKNKILCFIRCLIWYRGV